KPSLVWLLGHATCPLLQGDWTLQPPKAHDRLLYLYNSATILQTSLPVPLCCSRVVHINARGLGSQLKDSIPVTELSASGPFESHDLLRKGFSCVKNELLPSHPLELSEKNFQLNQDKMNFSTLRNIQGLFAPLKLQMEFKAVQQVQRLPFLPSSNLSLDILRGNDETIGFEDILNDPSQSELMGEPHMMVEYKLGLL
uniref:Proteasome maturation protein n=1 Tax=Rattus norvegicus TaxID=10116 RepID=M0RBE4_RAT